MEEIRPPELRRSWLFVGGSDDAALARAGESGADVIILELEDFTAPADRPAARKKAHDLFRSWRKAGAVAAVRVNPLSGDGLRDLDAVMPAVPDAVLLPKVSTPEQVSALERAVHEMEHAGPTELIPNVELALGLIRTYEIASASERVTGCLVASEDMAADLGAERGRDGLELSYVRQRFHVECRAAGAVSIDCPYTFTDIKGLEAETRFARRLGYTAKSCVRSDHVPVINTLLTPGREEVSRARKIVKAFEDATARGHVLVEVDGTMVEAPIAQNARRLLHRAELFERWVRR